MAITDLGHTALACHDLEASVAFYELIGLREAFRLLRDDGSVMLVYLHISGDRFLELFPGGPSPMPNRTGSFRHICLMTDDIEALVSRLKSAGIAIDREIARGLDHNLQAWIIDPDGNAIEFMQIADESPQRAIAESRSVQESETIKVPLR